MYMLQVTPYANNPVSGVQYNDCITILAMLKVYTKHIALSCPLCWQNNPKNSNKFISLLTLFINEEC